jgi:hypothetical protein
MMRRTRCLNIRRPREAFNGRPCFCWIDREELDVFVRLTGSTKVSTWIECNRLRRTCRETLTVVKSKEFYPCLASFYEKFIRLYEILWE